jgi:hypothetical protein
MRWWTKTLLWTGILLACAGVGAFIASRSNPFPPGVAGGGTNSPEPTPSPGQDADRWTLVLRSETSHTYRVGGACISHWRLSTPVRVLSSGPVSGVGTARLLPGAHCEFETAQEQARGIRVRILGRRSGSVLRLRFEDEGTRPAGSQDLGAFVAFLPKLRVAIKEQAGAQVARRQEFTDANGDVFVMNAALRLAH